MTAVPVPSLVADAAYEPTFSTALHPDLARDAEAEAALRACVDLPGVVRAHGLRLIVFAGALALGSDGRAREAARKSWTRSLEGYDTAAACFEHDGTAVLHPAVGALFAQVVPCHPEATVAIGRFRTMARALLGGIDMGEVGSRHDALMTFTYRTYVPTLTELERGIEAEVEAYHARRAAAAQDARARAQAMRGEIGQIARTIRLISLNARVEAAHAGAAGRAFGVISEEIRALSERTGMASARMGSSIDEILGNLRSG